MLYRRKIILALLQSFNGNLEKLRFQKLLFLLTQNQKKPVYEFIPYKYGCYSYSAGADLHAMSQKGQLKDDEAAIYKTDNQDHLAQLHEDDRNFMHDILTTYGSMNTHALIKHTYIHFPFYAINSIKASEILDDQFIERINHAKPFSNEKALFTIGYEGVSLEAYLNKLLKYDIKVLIDTRKNPLSRKFGFSKNQLQRYCESVGIDYRHFPETGIPSELRNELKTQEDYDQLFQRYVEQHLPETIHTQQEILKILDQYERVALTCFEANICQCHRKPLAEAIQNIADTNYPIKHI